MKNNDHYYWSIKKGFSVIERNLISYILNNNDYNTFLKSKFFEFNTPQSITLRRKKYLDKSLSPKYDASIYDLDGTKLYATIYYYNNSDLGEIELSRPDGEDLILKKIFIVQELRDD